MSREQREEIEESFNQHLADSELDDCLFSRNGGLTMRVYLESPSNQRRELFVELRGNIANFSYNPLSEETITDYHEIINFLNIYTGEE